MKATDALRVELVLDHLLEKLIQVCIKTVGAERAVLVLEKAGLAIRATAMAHGDVTIENTPIRAARSIPVSIIEYVYRVGEIVVLGDASDDKRFSADPYFASQRIKSILAAPLGPERRLGVLYFENNLSYGAFSEDRVEMIRRLTDEAAIPIENSMLFDERLRAESKLRLLSDVSAALGECFDYKACLKKTGSLVVPSIADWFVVEVLEGGVPPATVVAHANPEKAAMVEALYQDYPVDLESQDPQALALRSGRAQLVAEVTDEFERRSVQDEKYRALVRELEPRSLIAVPLVARAKTLGFVLFVRSQINRRYDTEDLALAEDLSRRMAQTVDNALLHRELREEMRQRIERDRFLSLMFHQLPGSVWATDRDLRLTYVTGRVAEELRTRPVPGMSIFEFLGTREPTDRAIAHHRAALSGERQCFQYKFANRWYDVIVEPLRNDASQIVGCLGVALDLTEKRENHERLTRSEARLAEAQRVAHIGSFEWDIAANVVTWSDELNRIYGLEPGQFRGTYEAFLELIHPDDLESTTTQVFDACRKAKPFVYDHRIIRSDGSVRMLHTRGDVITDEGGKAVRVVGSCWDITELHEATENRERARSLLEATIEATTDGLLVVDRNGKLTTYNQRFLSLWRIPAELARENDDETLFKFVLDQLEDPDSFKCRVHELYDHFEQESFDVLRFKDGRVFERYSTPQRIRDQIVGRVWSFRDVTERERLLRRALFLADATRLLASLDVEPALDSVAHLAVPFIGDGCAIDLLANGGPRRLLVVSRDPTQPINLDLHTAAITGHSTIYSVGTRSCMAIPLVVKGAVIGALTFVAARARRYTRQDLELGEELARRAALSVENAHLYLGAQEAVHARDEFMSIAAHEIRGPITAMHIAVQSLQKCKVPTPAMPKVLEIIEREDRRLARFVAELLDLGSIQSGQLHFNFEEVDLGDVVREVSSRLSTELAKTGSSLSITSEGRPVGQWDKFRLEQVMMNLLSNAIKFGLGKPIVVSVREHQRITRLVVKDEGIGIPSRMHEQIFKPFERAVSTRHYGGLGLGLYITRTIVEALGGTVQVESQPNAGSTFTVELPGVQYS